MVDLRYAVNKSFSFPPIYKLLNFTILKQISTMSAPAATKKVARSASKKKTTPSKDAPKAKRGDGQKVSNIILKQLTTCQMKRETSAT